MLIFILFIACEAQLMKLNNGDAEHRFKQVGQMVMDLNVEKKSNNQTVLKCNDNDQQKTKEVQSENVITLNSDVNITKLNIQNTLFSEVMVIHGHSNIDDDLVTGTFNSEFIRTKSIKTNFIENDIITIHSSVIFGDINHYLESNLPCKTKINDRSQWTQVSYDDFENQGTNWYDQSNVNSCDDEPNTNHFLGGHCKLGMDKITKEVKNLTDHKYVRIQATYHILDNWEDEEAYMEVDNRQVWTRRFYHNPKLLKESTCGNENYPDPSMNIVVDKIIKHKDPQIMITFGSTLNKNPCEASFAIDDLIIYIN